MARAHVGTRVVAALGVALGAAALGVAVMSGAQARQALDRTGGAGVGSGAAVGGRKAGPAPAQPETPSLETLTGRMVAGVRTFELTASQFEQRIANFPIKNATVWGYNGSTPGPTLLMQAGEPVRIVVKNELPPSDPRGDMPPGPRPTATTVHFHGLHSDNANDGVPGISQAVPIASGASFTYELTPRHAGSFAYHSHTASAVQELRGLDGMVVVLPASAPSDGRVDKDFVMTLQQFAPFAGPMDPTLQDGALVQPFPPGSGDFPLSTINGKTGEAAGSTLDIEEGDRVRIRVYNASNLNHAMHLHGHDFVVVSRNGHPVPKAARYEETTQDVAPGEFFEIEFLADNPGNWIFHCHIPHHTSNAKLDGYNGAPVGMTRVFHYTGYADVPPGYFAYTG